VRTRCPEPGVDPDQDDRPERLAGGREEPDLLVVAEEPDPRLRLLREPDLWRCPLVEPERPAPIEHRLEHGELAIRGDPGTGLDAGVLVALDAQRVDLAQP